MWIVIATHTIDYEGTDFIGAFLDIASAKKACIDYAADRYGAVLPDWELVTRSPLAPGTNIKAGGYYIFFWYIGF